MASGENGRAESKGTGLLQLIKAGGGASTFEGADKKSSGPLGVSMRPLGVLGSRQSWNSPKSDFLALNPCVQGSPILGSLPKGEERGWRSLLLWFGRMKGPGAPTLPGRCYPPAGSIWALGRNVSHPWALAGDPGVGPLGCGCLAVTGLLPPRDTAATCLPTPSPIPSLSGALSSLIW